MNTFLEKLLTIGRLLIPQPIFELFQPFYHQGLAYVAAVWYGFPSRKLKVIGVTGTNGKSTVVYLLDKILSAAGYKTASLSTIQFKVGELDWPNNLKMTMPGRFEIQKFLNQALFAGCKYAVLEVTSQGIAQSRHLFIDFEATVLTNLSPEHIEAHGGFENYKAAKLDLFLRTKNIHVLPEGDQELKEFADAPAEKKIFFALSKNDLNLKLRIPGEFNLANALTAAAAARALGIAEGIIKMALEQIESVPGRAERVSVKGRDGDFPNIFQVIVDYAHTPVALEQVYKTFSQTSPLRLLSETSPLICVFGSAGGGRDKWKRPELGAIASKYCKQIILTDEDPYEENPNQIIAEIEAGITPEKKSVTAKIIDRGEAIKTAISSALPGDTVMITGKGTEEWMMVGKTKTPWNERRIVREALTDLLHPKKPSIDKNSAPIPSLKA